MAHFFKYIIVKYLVINLLVITEFDIIDEVSTRSK
jgi:hypothetical protein